MPELIDLEVARENMEKRLRGKKLRSVNLPVQKVLRNASQENIEDFLVGQILTGIERRGKLTAFLFENISLVVHLMLHGDFCWRTEGKNEKNVVLALEFEEAAVLVKDWSRWTEIELHAPDEDFVSDLWSFRYGPDPLSTDFNEKALENAIMQKPRSNIKKVLTEQTLIAGIGNAYADEILWDAKIHPVSKAGAIQQAGLLARLLSSIQSVLEHALQEVRARAAALGDSISEQERDFMKVYRRSGQKCPRCSYMIACLKVNSRDTFVCEKCQEKV